MYRSRFLVNVCDLCFVPVQAVNAYYGCYLYALATNNVAQQKFAKALLSMEIYSVRTYWHMNPSTTSYVSSSFHIVDDDDVDQCNSKHVYDDIFARRIMVGNVGEMDITSHLWFGSAIEMVAGINMLPLSPITASLFDSAYVQNLYPLLSSAIPSLPKISDESRRCDANVRCAALQGLCCPDTEGLILECCNNSTSRLSVEWESYIYIYQACKLISFRFFGCDRFLSTVLLIRILVVDRDAAWKNLLNMPAFGNGNSKANSLYWAASRNYPLAGWNNSFKVPISQLTRNLPSSCAAYSACDVLG
jgi:hypothetical protein